MVAAWGSLWLFGGTTKDGLLCGAGNDLWRWDGAAWTEVPEAGPWPTARHRFAMALDEAAVGERIVVHGGTGDDADTWTLRCDGACPPGSPAWDSFPSGLDPPDDGTPRPAWLSPALVAVPELGGVLAFGGAAQSAPTNDLWLIQPPP